MEVVVAPVLHIKVPVKAPAVKTVLPQLLVGVIVGAVGMATGAAVPLPAELVQPFVELVWVTV